ncbi:hypothetical protein I317_06310 [Kwoniella heveanensis CBS 569]|nr:hypothetical protein I317_06310 [Kwoniella heveanensis CBS 569]
MITLRAARNSAFRLSRGVAGTVTTSHSEGQFSLLPHAESSSAPFQRQLSSTLTSRRHDAEASVQRQSEGGSVARGGSKGKDKHRTNPRLRRQAMANAKKLAEALKTEAASKPPLSSSARQDIPLPTKSDDQSFWADMLVKPTTFNTAAPANSATTSSSSLTAPSLEDLLAKRPEYSPREPWHPRYQKQYRRIYESIDSAFVLKQMRDFAKDLNIGISGRTRNSKSLIIKKIMRSWNWVEPMPKPVERPPESQVFDLPASELFLFLRDNELVQAFTQDEDDSLDLSVVPYSQAPKSVFHVDKPEDEGRMVLLATGRDEPLARLNAALKERKESIHTIDFSGNDIHGQIPPVELLQYRATAMSVEEAEEAKRLLRVAVYRTRILPSTRSLSTILPVVPHFHASSPPITKFSLYPFTPSLTEPLSWDMIAQTYSKSLFRLRKVRQWNNKPAMRELDHKQENMGEGRVKALSPTTTPSSTLFSGTGNQPLYKIMSDFIRQDAAAMGQVGRLTVSFGHLLYSVSPKDGRIGPWDSPLPGQWYFETLPKWLGGNEERKPFFAPSLTPAMIQYPLPGSSRLIRRIRYRSILSPASEAGTEETQFLSFTGGKSEAKWQDRLGDFLDQMEKEIKAEEKGASSASSTLSSGSDSAEAAAESDTEEGATSEGRPKVQVTTPVAGPRAPEDGKSDGNSVEAKLEIVAERGVLRELDLHIPDRPTDARFTATFSESLSPDSIPEGIAALFRSHLALDQANTPPLSSSSAPAHLEFEDVMYELELDEYLEVNEDVGDGATAVTKRMVRSIDQGLSASARPVVYNEIEFSTMADADPEHRLPDEFYEELAMVTRDIGPDASALSHHNAIATSGAAGTVGHNPLMGLASWDQ